jgi:hypothetical protein
MAEDEIATLPEPEQSVARAIYDVLATCGEADVEAGVCWMTADNWLALARAAMKAAGAGADKEG